MRRLYRWVRSWTRFDWLWIFWIALGLGIEYRALRDLQPGGTLTDSLRWATANGRPLTPRVRAVRIVGMAATAWAVVHVWRKGWV